jgi:hypothetical protein
MLKISFLSPSSSDTRSSEMGEQPIILKAKPLCLNNCLVLVHSGPFNQVALTQANNHDSTTKLGKRAGKLANSIYHFYSNPSEFHNQLGLENSKSGKLHSHLSTQGISYYASLIITLRSALVTSFSPQTTVPENSLVYLGTNRFF